MKKGDHVRFIHEGRPVQGVIVGALPEFDAHDVRLGEKSIIWNKKAKELELVEEAS